MAFVAAMVMGMQIDDVEATRIAAEQPAPSRSAAPPPGPSAQSVAPSRPHREQRPATPEQEAMELRAPLARGVVQA
jgi:hypothetical protein